MRTDWQLLESHWDSKTIKEDQFNPIINGIDLKSIIDLSHNF
jgi:hypothetical protein